MKKMYYFAMICLYGLGLIGGIGWSLYGGGYLIAVGVTALGWMAFPTVKDYFNKLMG